MYDLMQMKSDFPLLFFSLFLPLLSLSYTTVLFFPPQKITLEAWIINYLREAKQTIKGSFACHVFAQVRDAFFQMCVHCEVLITKIN